METIVQLMSRVRNAFAVSRIMLPGTVIFVQPLPADFIEIIHVDIDVVIAVTVIAAVVVVVIIVVMVMIIVVIVPVDITENGVGRCDAEAKAQAFYQAIGKLLARRRGQINRRIAGAWPGAVNRVGVVRWDVNHLRIGGFYLDYRWAGCRCDSC
ncbi:hypothetical protein D3C71_1484120 [compost metagenome]